MTKKETQTKKEIDDITRELLKTDWVEEAKQIPQDNLDQKEKTLLNKCIQKQEFTQKELGQLKKILARYREALREQKPDETLENIENNIQLVQDEKTFLKLIEDADKKRQLIMRYPVDNNTTVDIELQCLPITDSKAILDIQENLNLFTDLTTQETTIYNKAQNNETLTKEEQEIYQNITNKINQKTQEHQQEIIIEFLAMQTRFKHGKSTYKGMKKIYQKMQIGYLALLFNQVQKMTGLQDIETEEVFQKIGD